MLIFLPLRQPLKEFWLSPDVYDAVAAGDAAKVEKLMQSGADPNRFGAGGLAGGTPVTWAIRKSDVKILEVLIRHGADVNKVDHGSTPMDQAAAVYKENVREHRDTKASLNVIQLLKRAGATQALSTKSAVPAK